VGPDPGRAAILGLLLMGLASAEAATSCTTRWDAGLQRHLTPCLDGWQFKSTYDRDFQTWRTRELTPWKPFKPRR
jgi:hypothetical protein